jgi:hypothetical protein
MATCELGDDLKRFIDGQLCLIYECGENRDDICDNINAKTVEMDDDCRQAFYDYRDAQEARYLAR